MLLEIRDGTVSQNGQTVLYHFNFHIRGTEKIAIVGRNGAGKTTLLQVLAGWKDLDPDEKDPAAGLFRARAFSVGMLEQQAVQDPSLTVEELARGQKHCRSMKHGHSMNDGHALKENPAGKSMPAQEAAAGPQGAEGGRSAASFRTETGIDSEQERDTQTRFNRLFTQLGFALEDRTKQLREFSGGEQTKLMLLSALLQQPEVLLLDEPTNHLDLATTEWLEEQLHRYPGAVVVVSHDRYFMDRVAEVTWEVSGGHLTEYAGNYSAYRQEKTRRLEQQRRAYEAQQQEIRRQEELIERFRHKPRKAAFARSRRSMLERMERIPKPEEDDAVIHTGDLEPEQRGPRVVLDCDHLLIGYEKPLCEISLRIRRGEKIGVFGPNGSGKSTFLKTMAGLLPAWRFPAGADQGSRAEREALTGVTQGRLRLGENVTLAYYDQHSAEIRDEHYVFDWFHDRFPGLRGEEVRSYLAGFLFHHQDMGKQVSSLSGGEKARLVLAELLAHRPNFLVLDEPTNNMDIPAKETLESIFRSYTGTMLFVSHDRYFLSHVAESLLLFEAAGTTAGAVEFPSKVRFYPFGYDQYRKRQDQVDRGETVSIAREAEEQRLIEGLRSVPEKERRERPLSTREASLDWQFRLNEEERVPAEEAYAVADAQLAALPETEEAWEQWSGEEAFRSREEAADKACREWTRTLLDWYDLWQEAGQQT